MTKCKRCLLLDADEEAILREVQFHISKITPKEKADDDTYRLRLNACQSCNHLIDGVCMKCGCYVELRAAFTKMKCPDAASRRW